MNKYNGTCSVGGVDPGSRLDAPVLVTCSSLCYQTDKQAADLHQAEHSLKQGVSFTRRTGLKMMLSLFLF